MNLAKIIEESGLRTDFVASRLFPNNRHPYNALNRVLAKGASLDADQVRILATLTGRTADDLLGLSWSGKIESNTLTLSRGDYRVIYTPGAGLWALLKSTPLGFEQLGNYLISETGTTVREFIATVEETIKSLN